MPHSHRRLNIALLGTVLAGGLSGPAWAQSAPWDAYANNTTSVFLPYTKQIKFDRVKSGGAHLEVGINGAPPGVFELDTGSTGIAIGKDTGLWKPDAARGDVKIGAGLITYNSDGRVLTGDRWETNIDLYDPNTGRIVANSRVPVLYITRETKFGVPVEGKMLTTMFGVGFDRQKAGMPDGTPSANPLLNITALAKGDAASLVRGYVVTENGVDVGLTAANTQGATFIKLLPNPGGSDAKGTEWQATPVTIEAGGATGSGTLLPDTGLYNMFIRPPDGSSIVQGKDVPKGTRVTVYLPGVTDPQAAMYSFIVGDKTQALSPKGFVYANDDPAPYINTTIAILRGFNIIYDADSGFSGFQRTVANRDDIASTPMMTLQGSLSLASGVVTTLPAYLMSTTRLHPVDVAELDGTISGPGGLTLEGGGLILTGQNTYAGRTTVASGALVVDGSIASAVTVAGGATLGGGGTVGAIEASPGAFVAPGLDAPFSTLGVSGNLRLQADATYQVRTDPAGRSDAIAVDGAADVSGAHLAVLAGAGDYARRTRYTILTALGGLSGRFADVATDLAFLTPHLGYGPDAVTLTLTRNDMTFAQVARTPNQRAAATAVDATFMVGTPVFEALVGTTAEQARPALDALSGDVHAGAVTSGFESARIIGDVLLSRLDAQLAAEAGNAPTALAALVPTPDLPAGVLTYAPTATDPSTERTALWGTGFGDFGRNSDRTSATAIDRTLGGFVIGLDTRIDAPGLDRWRLGVLGGYTNTRYDVDRRAAAGIFETYFGGVYAGALLGAFDVKLGATAGGTQTNVNRTVAFPGFVETARASYGGSIVQGFGEIGTPIPLFRGTIEPIAAASAVHIEQGGFREDGGTAALVGAGRSYDVQTTTLGFRGRTALPLEWPVVARTFLGWRHAFGDVRPQLALAFAGGSADFGVAGPAIDRDAVVGEFGLDVRAGDGLTVGISYVGQAGRRASDNAVKGRAEVRF